MYKIINEQIIQRLIDGAFIHAIGDMQDSQAYQAWLAEGNTPEPADVPPAPTYQELRAAAYPPITDYLDGIVKGDTEQVAKYVADCLAVKALYPKP